MICASVAPEHQGSDLLLRTNCVSWILIILFASPAWHGFVIYPALEAVEGRNLFLFFHAETAANHICPNKTQLPWLYCIQAKLLCWCFCPWLHFYRLTYERSIISDSCGPLLSLNQVCGIRKHRCGPLTSRLSLKGPSTGTKCVVPSATAKTGCSGVWYAEKQKQEVRDGSGCCGGEEKRNMKRFRQKES